MISGGDAETPSLICQFLPVSSAIGEPEGGADLEEVDLLLTAGFPVFYSYPFPLHNDSTTAVFFPCIDS